MAVSSEPELLTPAEQLAQQVAENARLHAQVQELLTLVAELRGTVEKQQDHIAKLVKMHFGRKSERIAGPTLFDDLPGGGPDDPAAPPVTPVIPEPDVLYFTWPGMMLCRRFGT